MSQPADKLKHWFSAAQPNWLNEWPAKLVGIFLPLLIMLAHFSSGADGVDAITLFYLAIVALLVVLVLGSGLSSITTGMLSLASLMLVWIMLGLYGNWYEARAELLALASGLAIWSMGRILGASSAGLQATKSALIWTLLVFALVAFIAHSVGQQEGGPIIHREFKGRLMAGFGSPNTAATLFVISALVAVSSIGLLFKHREFRTRQRRDQINYVISKGFAAHALLILSLSCLVLTSSRAGNVIGLVALFVLVALDFRIGSRMSGSTGSSFSRLLKTRRGLMLSGFSAGIVFFIWSSTTLASRSRNILADTGERGELYARYWDLWRDEPWFGHGLGSFNAVNDAAMTMDAAPQMIPVGAAHNVALQWLIQQGLVGTVIMMAVLMALHRPIIYALVEPASRPRNFLRMVVAVSFVVLAHGMVDYALEIPSVMWTWALLLGLGTGFATRTQATNSSDIDYSPSEN
ncbi:MAG: O-antigen ligase family protein [Henriciella sp.]|nr:O-antigen ligase family protein [Henriciella sp.]